MHGFVLTLTSEWVSIKCSATGNIKGVYLLETDV